MTYQWVVWRVKPTSQVFGRKITPPADNIHNKQRPWAGMDLSGEVTAALRLLGDASKTEQAKYKEVLQKVAEDIAKDTPANSSAPQPAGEEDGELLPTLILLWYYLYYCITGAKE